jgi:hypothetical protein
VAARSGWSSTTGHGCLNHHRRHICDKSRTIRRAALEQRTLAGPSEKLVSADRVQKAVAQYAELLNRENRERRIQAEADCQALDRIDRGIAGIVAAIEDGMYQPTMRARVAELERQKAEIASRIAAAASEAPYVHPGMAEDYRRTVARFIAMLGDPESRPRASAALRSVIDGIILHPGERRGEVQAYLHGKLMGIIDFVRDTPQRAATLVITKVASGSAGRPYCAATFRNSRSARNRSASSAAMQPVPAAVTAWR